MKITPRIAKPSISSPNAKATAAATASSATTRLENWSQKMRQLPRRRLWRSRFGP
jgi:hypothetical protein